MSVIRDMKLDPMIGDPDDHRPRTMWAVMFDPPVEGAPYVRDLTCIVERIAPGDAIPLHTHSIDELVIVDRGEGTYRLGDEETPVGEGAMVFIPAGVAHGTVADAERGLDIHAVFGAAEIDITYLERNPAPGTESDPVRPTMRFDPRVDTV